MRHEVSEEPHVSGVVFAHEGRRGFPVIVQGSEPERQVLLLHEQCPRDDHPQTRERPVLLSLVVPLERPAEICVVARLVRRHSQKHLRERTLRVRGQCAIRRRRLGLGHAAGERLETWRRTQQRSVAARHVRAGEAGVRRREIELGPGALHLLAQAIAVADLLALPGSLEPRLHLRIVIEDPHEIDDVLRRRALDEGRDGHAVEEKCVRAHRVEWGHADRFQQRPRHIDPTTGFADLGTAAAQGCAQRRAPVRKRPRATSASAIRGGMAANHPLEVVASAPERRRYRWIFPVAVFGRSEVKWTRRGNLYGARWLLQCAINSAASPSDGATPSRRTTQASGLTRPLASGMPATAASTTNGWATSWDSISIGEHHIPPTFIMSSLRPQWW